MGIKKLGLGAAECIILKLMTSIERSWRFGGENKGGDGGVRRCWIVGA